MVVDTPSCTAISAISGGIDFSALAAAQFADPVDMAACQTAIMKLQLKNIPLDTTQTFHMIFLLVGHVSLYLSPSAAIFLAPFMALAIQAYGQPAS